MTIALTFPTDIDPEQVRNILLNAYHEYENIRKRRRLTCASASWGRTALS
ncbi:hypothetical protein M8494_09970 [Serratia ureilytica]